MGVITTLLASSHTVKNSLSCDLLLKQTRNFSTQMEAVKQLSVQVKTLEKEKGDLKVTNEMLFKTVRSLTHRKDAVDTELKSCNERIKELQAVVRLQKKGNRILERQSEEAQQEASRSAELVVSTTSSRKRLGEGVERLKKIQSGLFYRNKACTKEWLLTRKFKYLSGVLNFFLCCFIAGETEAGPEGRRSGEGRTGGSSGTSRGKR